MANILDLLKNEELLIRKKLISSPKEILNTIKKQYKIEKSETKKDPALKVLSERRERILEEQKILAKKGNVAKLQEKVREELNLIQKIELFEKRESKGKVEEPKKELKQITEKKLKVRPALVITFILILLYFSVSFYQDLQAKTKVPAGYAYIQISNNCVIISKIDEDIKKSEENARLYKKYLEEISHKTKKNIKDVCIEADLNSDGILTENEINSINKKYS